MAIEVIEAVAIKELHLGDLKSKSGNTSNNIRVRSSLDINDGLKIICGQASGLEIGDSANEKIGFWGKTPVVQQVLATGVGATVDQVITMLQTIGICKQS